MKARCKFSRKVLARALVGAAILAGALAPPPAFSESVAAEPTDGYSLEPLGQYGGPSHTVAWLPDHALLGVGPSLEVLDIATPQEPVLLRRYTYPGTVLDVAVAGNIAFVLDSSCSLHILDIAVVTQARLLSRLNFPSDVSCDFRELNVYQGSVHITGLAGLASLDVSDPRRPRWVGLNSAVGPVADATIEGDKLLLVTQDAVVRVLSLADPSFPVPLGEITIAPDGYGSGIAVQDGLAYVSVWSYDDLASADEAQGTLAPVPTTSRVAAIDVASPTSLREVGEMNLSLMLEFPGRIEVDGGFGYMVAYQYGGPLNIHGNYSNVIIFDIEDRIAPSFHSQYGYQDDVGTELSVAGGLILVAEERGGMRIMDRTDPAEPSELSHYDVPYVPRAVAADSGRVVVGDAGTKGVWTLDARQPELAEVEGHVGNLNLCLAYCHISTVGEFAYVADFNEALVVVDASDRGAPRPVAQLMDARRAVAMDAAGQFVYIGTQPDGVTSQSELVIVNASNPAEPRRAGVLALPAFVSDVAYHQGHVYAVSSGGLSVVEVVDRTRPRQVGAIALGGPYSQVAAAGDFAYVVESDGALHVVDVSRPDTPTYVGHLDKARQDAIRPNSVTDLVVSGNIAYVLHTQWIQAIDVSTPSSPHELTWQSVPGAGLMDMTIDRGLLYIVSQTSGLHVYYLHRSPAADRIWLPFLANR